MHWRVSLWLDAGRDRQITYCLSDAYGLGWTAEQKQSFADAFASFAAVCNLTFVEVPNEASADMVEYRVTSPQFAAAFPSSPYGAYRTNWAGYHYGPDDAPAGGSADGYFDTNQINAWLISHELLHGLGLEHPHNTMHGTGLFPGVSNNVGNDFGDYGLNNTLNTLMSYNILPGYTEGEYDGPMAMDIAALQFMYGANMSTASGDDVYVLARANYKTIWDAGGIDWLVAGTDNGATLDLRSATLVLGNGAGGWLSQAEGFTGGYSIAYGAEIENARGGAGDDTLVGNELFNILDGGDGDDIYYTDDAGDLIIDSSGTDVVVSNVNATLVDRLSIENLLIQGSAIYGTGNTNSNVLWGNAGNNVLNGLGGDDWLFGGGGVDYLYGGEGNDLLVGQAGRDFMWGGSGSDTFDFNSKSESTVSARDVIMDFERGSDIIDLSTIDANSKKSGNQAFTWIGTKKFSGAGQLHYVVDNRPGTDLDKVYVEGDINGDRKADFRIEVDGLLALSKYDFFL